VGLLALAVTVVYVLNREPPSGTGPPSPAVSPAPAAAPASPPSVSAAGAPRVLAGVEIPGLRDALARSNKLDQVAFSGKVENGVLEIDLSDNLQLTSLEALKGSPVGRLTIVGTGVQDLSPLAGAPLVELNAGKTRVKDLSPLARCPLESLSLLYAPVEDLSPLKGKSLKKIDFDLNTARRGVEALKEMSSLREINGEVAGDFWVGYALRSALHQANPDYQFQGEFRLRGGQVEEASLVACNLKDLAPLAKLPSLKRLSLYATEIADLSPLKGLRLEALELGMISLKSLEGLAGMKLSELNVSSNHELTDLSPLADMPLTRLDLSDTGVSDLAPIQSLPDLLYLDLRGTRVVDVAPLAGTNLIILWIDRTKVNDLAPLKGLSLLLLSFEHSDLPRWPRGIAELQQMKSLRAVGLAPDRLYPAQIYWQVFSSKEKVEAEKPPIGDKLPLLAEAGTPKETLTASVIYARASPSVVLLKTNRGTGSGVCVGTGGLILTNHHLIQDADPSEIRAIPFLYNGRRALHLPPVKARIIYDSPGDDLTALRLDPVPVYMSPLEVAGTSPPTGDAVYAIGSPAIGTDNPEQSMTTGAISGSPNLGGKSWLQHNAAVNPGNSGGPLLNAHGQVVGIVTLKAAGAEGVSLAIPAERIREIFKQSSG
jgi:Leucine-rich repeat (LRR) protein